MHHARIVAVATMTISRFAATPANACYRHTFDKCESGIQVAEANSASQPAQSSKLRSPVTAPGSGWLTTVTVSR